MPLLLLRCQQALLLLMRGEELQLLLPVIRCDQVFLLTLLPLLLCEQIFPLLLMRCGQV